MQTWEAQLCELESLMGPLMESRGLAAFCRADLWLDHPALKAACEHGDRLFAVHPEHGLLLSGVMLEAIAAAVGTPAALGLVAWAWGIQQDMGGAPA